MLPDLQRDLGPLKLSLARSPHGDVAIQVAIEGWDGVARFPSAVADEGYAIFQDIQTPNDLEDLLRPWSDEETWETYQELRNHLGF